MLLGVWGSGPVASDPLSQAVVVVEEALRGAVVVARGAAVGQPHALVGGRRVGHDRGLEAGDAGLELSHPHTYADADADPAGRGEQVVVAQWIL